MNGISETAAWIICIGGATAVVGGWWRWVRPRWKEARATAKEFRDAVLGRPALTHPDTGKELAPAVPGIGARQANMEAQLAILTGAVAAVADQNKRLDDHERRIGELEAGQTDRALARTETIELLRAMEAAIKMPPPADPEKK